VRPIDSEPSENADLTAMGSDRAGEPSGATIASSPLATQRKTNRKSARRGIIFAPLVFVALIALEGYLAPAVRQTLQTISTDDA
jgi:hypothetical protein